MRTRFKFLIPISVAAAFLLVLFLALQSAEITAENSTRIDVTVASVEQGGLDNIALTFYDTKGVFTIPEASKKGLRADSLKRQLVNKTIKVSYLKPGIFSRLHPASTVLYITELSHNQNVIYSEF